MASETKSQKIGVEEARREIAGGKATAVDVRSDEEWSEGHVPGALHLPDGERDSEAGGNFPEEGARLMVIAKDGKLAGQAAAKLADEGYDAVAVDGGMDDWESEDFNLQPTPDPDEDTELGLS
jgi:rhodanese-related sulfurtransferase